MDKAVETEALVTVLMPVYNAGPYLTEAVNSILSQTYTNIELLVINDGSSDDSQHILETYSDTRIRLLRNEQNKGLVETLNRGIREARGKYIARMDADDGSLPKRIERQVEYMERNPDTGVCGTWICRYANPSEVSRYPENHTDIRLHLLYECPLAHPSVMIRREVLEKHNLRYDSDYRHAEDYELWSRMASLTRFHNIPEVLLRYRAHEDNVSARYSTEQSANTRRIIQKQLREIGMEPDEADTEIFLDISYSRFPEDEGKLKRTEAFLIDWIRKNGEKKIFPTDYLIKYIAVKWFHCCYNAAVKGRIARNTYFGSPLPRAGLYNSVKLVLKTLTRSRGPGC